MGDSLMSHPTCPLDSPLTSPKLDIAGLLGITYNCCIGFLREGGILFYTMDMGGREMNEKNLRLPQFLGEVDALTANMSQGELKELIHEVARTWPENERHAFIKMIKLCSSKALNERESSKFKEKEVYEGAVKEIQRILGILSEISNGERTLDSEYNEEWDEWYNSDAEEVLFSDPDGIIKDIDYAMRYVHYCVDTEMYREGCELAETLSALQISVEGDYNDFDDEPLSISGLNAHHLLTSDYDTYVKECLYLIYMGNTLDSRAEELFCILGNLGNPKVTLEDIMQMGNSELPDFEEFLGMWIEYLGKQKGRYAECFLKEAQSMLKDDDILLENARKYVKEHPSLYKQILESRLNTTENEKMFRVGMEALASIPISYIVRSDVALLTAEYAVRMGKQKDAEKCWLEAFRSNSTVMNYWRIRLFSTDWESYRNKVQTIYESLYEDIRQREKRYSYDREPERENDISLNEYCTFLAYDGKFEQMKKAGMNTRQSLGWSSTYMKQGLAFILLKLYKGTVLPAGLSAMQMKIGSVSGINAEKFYQGTGRNKVKTDYELLSEIIAIWKNSSEISDKDIEKWLNKIDKLIADRVAGIMDNNHRNYYGECASYIAAFGEVQESFGIRNAKAIIMEKYKSEYSRRRAFHKELRAYGMKK